MKKSELCEGQGYSKERPQTISGGRAVFSDFRRLSEVVPDPDKGFRSTPRCLRLLVLFKTSRCKTGDPAVKLVECWHLGYGKIRAGGRTAALSLKECPCFQAFLNRRAVWLEQHVNQPCERT